MVSASYVLHDPHAPCWQWHSLRSRLVPIYVQNVLHDGASIINRMNLDSSKPFCRDSRTCSRGQQMTHSSHHGTVCGCICSTAYIPLRLVCNDTLHIIAGFPCLAQLLLGLHCRCRRRLQQRVRQFPAFGSVAFPGADPFCSPQTSFHTLAPRLVVLLVAGSTWNSQTWLSPFYFLLATSADRR